MKEITLLLPEALDFDERQTRRFLAAKLYESGKLSLGQAAEMADLSKTTFAEILADYDVSLINYPSDDIARDAARF